MFVSGRDLENIKSEDLYAVSYATVSVDLEKQSVHSDIYGFAKTTAIYRKGLGCTLVNEIEEATLRGQAGLAFSYDSIAAQDLLSAPLPTGMDSMALFQAINRIFTEPDTNNLQRTRAVVILYDGKIIAEKYAPNISPQTPLLGWSMTKSVTNAMIGLLVHDGKLDMHKPAPVQEWQQDARAVITPDQLLRMSSGLAFEENYSKPSDATRMLFRSKSAGNYAIQSKPAVPPDAVFYYSSGTSNILQEIIRRQFPNHADYLAFPHKRLFSKIGMKSAVIEPDASGTYVGSSFMFATARDWAKFGQLYLQDGMWKGERILPEGWARYSGTETPRSGGQYAAHFWINHTDKDFPQDAYYADGFEGQFVTIIPSRNMVIVRMGCTPGVPFDNGAFVKAVLGKKAKLQKAKGNVSQ